MQRTYPTSPTGQENDGGTDEGTKEEERLNYRYSQGGVRSDKLDTMERERGGMQRERPVR